MYKKTIAFVLFGPRRGLAGVYKQRDDYASVLATVFREGEKKGIFLWPNHLEGETRGVIKKTISSISYI